MNLYQYADSVGKPFLINTNLYNYTNNNPVNYTDPLGLFVAEDMPGIEINWHGVCGPGKGDFERLIPDHPFGINFSDCCKEHDDCYGCKGKQEGKNKQVCDQQFKECLKKKCKLAKLFGMPCPDNLYFWAVDLGGKSSYDNSRQCCGE